MSRVDGVVAPLDRVDVDTDQIIPKQFLTRIERTGYGAFLFHDWRRTETGTLREEFILNREPYASAKILVAGRNFGCGSSREHAAWAIAEFGFGAVIAPSLADIFRSNCLQTGIVPVVLTEAEVRKILDRAMDEPGYSLSVDVSESTVRDQDGFMAKFPLDPFQRRTLMEGLDPIALALEDLPAIERYEAGHPIPSAWARPGEER